MRSAASRLIFFAVLLSCCWVVAGGGDHKERPYSGDVMTTASGQVLRGRVLQYDKFSYMVILEDGGRVQIPFSQVEKVERQGARKARYAKRARLLVSTDVVWEGTRPVLMGRLAERHESDEQWGLKVEAQTLTYLLDTQEQYADALRTSYSHGLKQLELEYDWAKDLLIRRWREPGLGRRERILGPSGQGKVALEQLARGKKLEDSSYLSGIFTRDRQPIPERQRTVTRPKPTPVRHSTW